MGQHSSQNGAEVLNRYITQIVSYNPCVCEQTEITNIWP